MNAQIELLHDIRNRIISDAVTGQIDDRDIEVPEFEYVDEEADDESDEIDDADAESEEKEE